MEIERNDQEVVALFREVIISTNNTANALGDPGLSTAASVQELPPLVTSYPGWTPESVRGKIRRLHLFNTTIILDHHLNNPDPSASAMKAAVGTIQLIEASQKEGLTMCLW